MDKQKVFEAFKAQVELKIRSAQEAMDEATESVHSETKSTAGDKHETARAMAQLEVENAGKILRETQQLASVIPLLAPEKHRESCVLGAVAETTQGILYLSAALGRISAGEKEIICVGMNSPVGQALIGKKAGEAYLVANREHKVLHIS